MEFVQFEERGSSEEQRLEHHDRFARSVSYDETQGAVTYYNPDELISPKFSSRTIDTGVNVVLKEGRPDDYTVLVSKEWPQVNVLITSALYTERIPIKVQFTNIGPRTIIIPQGAVLFSVVKKGVRRTPLEPKVVCRVTADMATELRSESLFYN